MADVSRNSRLTSNDLFVSGGKLFAPHAREREAGPPREGSAEAASRGRRERSAEDPPAAQAEAAATRGVSSSLERQQRRATAAGAGADGKPSFMRPTAAANNRRSETLRELSVGSRAFGVTLGTFLVICSAGFAYCCWRVLKRQKGLCPHIVLRFAAGAPSNFGT